MMLVAVAFAAVGALIFMGFFWKINWVQDLSKQEKKSSARRGAQGQDRKIGQVPPVYPNGWFGILESSSLKKGQVEHVAALGQNLAVFRETGKARIINAYCPHLGANMAEGGQVKGEELECPFHSWRFCGQTGRCTSVPYSKNVPASIKTKVWESTEANGLIFVWHHAESASPDWYPRPIESISNGSWKYQGRNEFHEIPENGADWAHLEAVHGASVVSSVSKIMRHSWTNASWSLAEPEPEPEPERDGTSEKHVAIVRLRHSLVIFDKFSLMGMNVVAVQIGPSYVELHLDTGFGPLCIVQTVIPVAPLRQKVTHLMFAPRLAAPYSKIVMIGETLMFSRDVRVWNHKKYMANPMLVNEDANIKRYRRWYKQFYSDNSPTYEMCTRSLEW